MFIHVSPAGGGAPARPGGGARAPARPRALERVYIWAGLDMSTYAPYMIISAPSMLFDNDCRRPMYAYLWPVHCGDRGLLTYLSLLLTNLWHSYNVAIIAVTYL